jgi:lipopolysaccharide transport system ATP-binding protein
MAIEFRGVSFPPLHDLTVSAPNGAVIGVIGEKGAGKSALLRLAAGVAKPAAGDIVAAGERRYLGLTDALQLSPVDLLAIEHTFAQHDPLVRARALVGIDRLRSSGTTVLIASHESLLLRSIADEVWWLDSGTLVRRGDPREVLDAYNQCIAAKFRLWGEKLTSPIRPSLRRGDGRAEVVALETLGASGQATMIWQSGERVTVRAIVRYSENVEDPVIGIMIRTRIGLEVFGTNTELERVKTSACAAGDRLQVDFQFRCDLCPGEYTLTAASHDPDGTAHDWLDDAVAFVVSDTRYTAGVANLRAKVEATKL